MGDDESIFRNIEEIHFEVTPMCNLNCKYCYAEPLAVNNEGIYMQFNVVEYCTNLLAEFSNKNNFQIIFHGGEPLLQKPEWFDECCSYISKKFKEKEKSLSFGLQTNNTLLNDKFIDVFKKHNIKIGVSLDGSEDIHNTSRWGGHIVINNIKKLQAENLFTGVITVVSHHNFDKIEIIYSEFFKLGFTNFALNIASAVGNGKFSEPLTAEQILFIYKQDYENLLKYDGQLIELRLIERIQRHFEKPDSQKILNQLRCNNPFCHAGSNMIFIKTNGDLFPCGSAGSNGKIQNFKLGNIFKSITKNNYYSILKQFLQKTDKYSDECQKCTAKYFCEHGCPAFDFIDHITPENKCVANKQFVSFLKTEPKEKIEKLLSYINE
jgi:uncharacterized protein